MDHDHARPGPADMRAALETARAILTGNGPAAHQAAGSGSCPQCTTKAAVSFGFAMVASAHGETIGLSEPLAARLAAAIAETERELGSALN